MISLIGSSHSRGAWGADGGDPSALLANMLGEALGCPVSDYSRPGHGSESYVDAYIQACTVHHPRLFIVELQVDRSTNWVWFSNQHSERLSQSDAPTMLASTWDAELSSRFMVIRHATGREPYIMTAWDGVEAKGHDLPRVLDMHRQVCAYSDDFHPKRIRSVRNIMSLHNLERLHGIPCLYWAVDSEQIDYCGPFIDFLDPDRFINGINGFGMIGTTQFLLDRMDRRDAIADEGDHLTKAANQLLVSDILVPSILRFAEENAIRL